MPIPLLLPGLLAILGVLVVGLRVRGRRRRRYVRLRLVPYRTDQATAERVVAMLEGLHRRVSARWSRRLWAGQPSVSLEVHWLVRAGAPSEALLAICCPPSLRASVEAAVRSAYPSASLVPLDVPVLAGGAMVRLRKRRSFIRPLALPATQDEEPRGVERLLGAMAATREACVVQLALTPAPSVVESYGRWLLGQAVTVTVHVRPPSVVQTCQGARRHLWTSSSRSRWATVSCSTAAHPFPCRLGREPPSPRHKPASVTRRSLPTGVHLIRDARGVNRYPELRAGAAAIVPAVCVSCVVCCSWPTAQR